MECLILFSGKNKKNITNLSSTELAQGAVNVNCKVSTDTVEQNVYEIITHIPPIRRIRHIVITFCSQTNPWTPFPVR